MKRLLKNIILIIASVLITFVIVSNVFFTTYIENDRSEKVYILKNSVQTILFVCTIMFVILFFNRCYYFIKNKIKDKLLDSNEFKKIVENKKVKVLYKIIKYLMYVIILLFYILIQVKWIHINKVYPASDQKYVYTLAARMFKNLNTDCIKIYFSRYPQQLSLAWVFYIIFKVCNKYSYMIIEYVNVIANTVSIIGIWLIARSLAKENKVNMFLLCITSIMYIPLILLSIFVYGDYISMPFVIFSIYFIMRYGKYNKNWYLVLSVIMISISYIIRMNNLIFIIAEVCYLILNFIENINYNKKNNNINNDKKEIIKYTLLNKKPLMIIKNILVICVFIILSITPQNIVKNIMIKKVDIDCSKTYPNIGYVYMGMQEGESGNGWYDAAARNIGLKDEKNAKQIYRDGILGRLYDFISNPMYGIKFYFGKAASMWTDNINQSIWYNMDKEKNGRGQSKYDYAISYEERTEIEKILINNQYLLACYQKALMFIIFISAFLIILSEKSKISNEKILLLICFIGGFLFHVIWEAKARYILPYIFILIPFSGLIFNDKLNLNIKKYLIGKKKKI